MSRNLLGKKRTERNFENEEYEKFSNIHEDKNNIKLPFKKIITEKITEYEILDLSSNNDNNKKNINKKLFEENSLINNKKEIKNEIKKEKIINENINIIKHEIKRETNNEIKNVQKLKKEELFDKNKLYKEKEIEDEYAFEFYDLYGNLNRKGIKQELLKFYKLKNHPNYKERIKYSKLIYQISQLCPQRKEKKLNFVFDLDSTLICSKILDYYNLNEVKEKYKSLGEYYQFIEVYNNAFQIQNMIVNYRNGIKSMFNKIKDISNLYIYTLSLGNYAETIKKYIEQLCKVKFEKMVYYKPNQNEERKKFFRKLNLSHFNTLILDDLEQAWYDPTIRHKCIINSMSYCCDKTYLIANQTYFEIRNKGINPPFYFNINTHQNENWLENLMMIVFRNPFKEISSGRFFHIETEKSNKKQLEYIGNLYVTVYNIMEFMNFKTICAMDAIKMIRITLFAGMIFDISNYYDESFNILRVLIISNGGEIFNGNNYYDDADYVYICNMNIYENNINDIENKKSKYYNFHLINEKYIFECSFCMTKFSLEDPEYILEE